MVGLTVTTEEQETVVLVETMTSGFIVMDIITLVSLFRLKKDMKENSGVSFSLKARPGSAVTTIEAINGTGVLYAVRDGAYHVSVYPIGGTIKQWHEWGLIQYGQRRWRVWL